MIKIKCRFLLKQKIVYCFFEKLKNILVVFGGDSLEHDISIITGVLVANSISKDKFKPIPCYINKQGFWFIGEKLFDVGYYKNLNEKELKRVALFSGEKKLYQIEKRKIEELFEIYCVINCVHGRCGEDGVIPSIIKASNLPIVSPNVLSSALTIDKSFCKKVLSSFGVLTVKGITLDSRKYFKNAKSWLEKVENEIEFPCIVKPCFGGSSIGVTIANNVQELSKSICKAFSFDDKILIEKFIKDAKEVNCAVYKKGEKLIVSKCLEPNFSSSFFTFDDKYLKSLKEGFEEKEKSISESLERKIIEISKQVYEILELNSIVRIDFLCEDNNVYLNEINSIPGSYAYYMFNDKISSITGLLADLIDETLANFRKENNVIKNFSSSVLSQKEIRSKK